MIDPTKCSHEEFLVEFASLVKKVDAILDHLSGQRPLSKPTPPTPAPFPQNILDLAAKLRCPVCRSDMKPRRRSKDGKPFFGCVRFPSCRGLRDGDGSIPDNAPPPPVSADCDETPPYLQ